LETAAQHFVGRHVALLGGEIFVVSFYTKVLKNSFVGYALPLGLWAYRSAFAASLRRRKVFKATGF
jgi:polyferredoxin